MSEFLDKRLSRLLNTAFEKAGVVPYEEVEEAAYISPHDISSKRRAHMLLANPVLLKCLSFDDITEIRKTGVVPDDLAARLKKQLKSDAEADE